MLRAIERATRQPHRADEPADRRCGQCQAHRQIQGSASPRRWRTARRRLQAGAGAAGDRNRHSPDRHRRRAREAGAGRHAAAAGRPSPRAARRRPQPPPAAGARSRATGDRAAGGARERSSKPRPAPVEKETFRIEVGSIHGVKPGNIVGAIANEADIEGVHIGRVDIREDHSFVDLPGGMPRAIFDGCRRSGSPAGSCA